MTDRTLSAAELDWLQETAQRRDVMHLGLGLAGQEARMQLIALDMARRTEAAERKVAKVEAIANSKTLLSGPWATKLDDIRRALAED